MQSLTARLRLPLHTLRSMSAAAAPTLAQAPTAALTPCAVSGVRRASSSAAYDPNGSMRALVYLGPHKRELQTRPRPRIVHPTDAIVALSHTTICGTDLHILSGDVPEVPVGTILGHEGVGQIVAVGAGCTAAKVGQRVVISCITACGKCPQCARTMLSHCSGGGGWLLGHLIDGTQAEFVRIPLADTSLHVVPAATSVSDERLTMLSDILPTAFECGVLNGQVKPGDSVAVVGCGPIGLAAIMTAQLYSPSTIIAVDIDQNRLDMARKLGATHTVDNSKGDAAEQIKALTEGKGADVSIECLGQPSTFDVCQESVAAGGCIANIGVHGKPVSLQLQKLWAHNIRLTTALVDTHSTPRLLKMVQAEKLQPQQLISHRYSLEQLMLAYDVFGQAAKQKAIKMSIQCDHAHDAPAEGAACAASSSASAANPQAKL